MAYLSLKFKFFFLNIYPRVLLQRFILFLETGKGHFLPVILNWGTIYSSDQGFLGWDASKFSDINVKLSA